MGDTYYCDNYEELTGRRPQPEVEAKVIAAVEEKPAPKHSAKAETKADK